MSQNYKVGDRVRIVNGMYWDAELNSRVGVIVDVRGEDTNSWGEPNYPYVVVLDGDSTYDSHALDQIEIEPEDAPDPDPTPEQALLIQIGGMFDDEHSKLDTYDAVYGLLKSEGYV